MEISTQLINRRSFVRFGVFSLLAPIFLPKKIMAADTASATFCNPTRPATPQDALTALADGNSRWVSQTQRHPGEDKARRQCVAKYGQTPFAAILSCSDSRVAPELIFDQGLGDLFVSRVAGNSADPIVEQSLAYGVANLGSLVLFVLGHSDCGAIKAAVANYPNPAQHFVQIIYPAVKKARKLVKDAGGDPKDPAQVIPVASDQHVLLTLDTLRNREPFHRLIGQGPLKVAAVATIWQRSRLRCSPHDRLRGGRLS